MRKTTKYILGLAMGMILTVLIKPLTVQCAVQDEEWNGSGSCDDPYQIASANELVRLRDDVNEGNSYKGVYFMLVEDIDLKFLGEWVPIGQYGSGNYFYGTFDGNGHKISNMTTVSSGNNGLFGMLGGTVMNLAVIDATVSGSCCGIIASHAASSEAIIINCITSGTMAGARTGGIADNFNGSIINCVSVLDEDTQYGITSYTAKLIYNCFSNQELFGKQFIGKCFRGAEVEDGDWGSVCASLNDSLIEGANYVQVDYTKLKEWVVDEHGSLIFGKDRDCSNMWEGNGNSEKPYIIASASDLIVLRDNVNAGENYQDIWFMLADDIDLAFCGEWIPIGQCGTGNYFYGIFDGNGHEITNMTTISSGNNGLFGALGGTVMNLRVTDCNVFGACCGTIASHAADSTAVIINCFSNGTVFASRSGGIADNFNGAIINCLTILEDKNVFGMVSYTASLLYNCYSNNPLFGSAFTGANYNNCVIEKSDLKDLCDMLNNGVIEGASYVGVDFQKLKQWIVDETGMISFGAHMSFGRESVFAWIKSQKVYIGLAVVTIVAGVGFMKKTRKH